jgi:micrococcal nuclease
VSYTYKATVIRVVDGDTVWLEVDLGFRMKTINDFRLYGVDTPERGQPGWSEATAFVNRIAPAGTEVLITTYKDPDKYGRWLVDISVDDDLLPINVQLIQQGLAKTYFGGKKQ